MQIEDKIYLSITLAVIAIVTSTLVIMCGSF